MEPRLCGSVNDVPGAVDVAIELEPLPRQRPDRKRETSWTSVASLAITLRKKLMPPPSGQAKLQSLPPVTARVSLQEEDRFCFDRVLREEAESIRRRAAERQMHDVGGSRPPGQQFSVAFSGGGVRAAAFQAGVLWRLAAEGRLKDVEYLIAVSGGSYVASSFISHVVDAGGPRKCQGVDAWYLGVVADTLCRMQRNASYLVRDACFAGDGGSGLLGRRHDGSGHLPPVFDLPVLLMTLVFAVAARLATFAMLSLIPLTHLVVVLFGGTARLALCARGRVPLATVFMSSVPVAACLWLLVGLGALVMATWLGTKVLPCCREAVQGPRSAALAGSGRLRLNKCFLFGRSTLSALTRTCFFLVFLLLLVFVCTGVEIGPRDAFARGGSADKALADACSAYIQDRRSRGGGQATCSDADGADAWWLSPLLHDEPPRRDVQADDHFLPSSLLTRAISNLSRYVSGQLTPSPYKTIGHLAALALATAAGLQPFFSGIFLVVLSLVGPLSFFAISMQFIRFRVFGPITSPRMDHDVQGWVNTMAWTFFADLALMLVQPGFASAAHHFYARSLRKAYFARGVDVPLQSVQANQFSPFLLVTGSACDYVAASSRAVHEITFSCLHTGSSDLGFVRPWSPSTLAKCSAMSGAITDAFVLGMVDKVKYRFWLEVLNIGMGNFILFQRPGVGPLLRSRGVKAWRRWLGELSSSSIAMRLRLRLPCIVLGACFYGSMLASALTVGAVGSSCPAGRATVGAALALMTCSFVLSFYGHLRPVSFLLHSPSLRHWHQVTRFRHMAHRPPELLHVVDGGIEDCTGLMQLFRRRRARILLVLAAEDPADEFTALRRTLEVAASERLASFYSPEHPARDVRIALDEFKEDHAAVHLHLCIDYGWRSTEEHEDGHLFVVKLRLPEGLGCEPASPLLTREGILGCGSASSDAGHPGAGGSAGGMLANVNGCCCTRFTCRIWGDRFPHFANANQWITPQMFNSLCRLGFRLSAQAVEGVSAGAGGGCGCVPGSP